MMSGDTRPSLGDTAHWSRALETCHEKRDPRQVLGSGNSGSAREKGQTKDPEQNRTLSYGEQDGTDRISESKTGSFCGASRDGTKGQADKDRHTLSIWNVLIC